MHAVESASTSVAVADVEWFRTLADATRVMIWFSGPDKQSTYFNQRWLEFTGRTIDRELGEGWADVIHPDDVGRCLQTYRDAFDARREFEVECRARRYDGTYRWHHNRGMPVHGSDGEFVGYIGRCIDITDRKRAEAHCQEVLERTAQTFFAIGLAASSALAASAREVAGPGVAARVEALARVVELASTGAEEVRAVDVRPAVAAILSRRAGRALLRLIGDSSKRMGARIDLVLTGDEECLQDSVAEALSAAARDALASIQRQPHSEALLMAVHIRPWMLTLCIQDDAGLLVRAQVPRGAAYGSC